MKAAQCGSCMCATAAESYGAIRPVCVRGTELPNYALEKLAIS
jgi:hypothetical protein